MSHWIARYFQFDVYRTHLKQEIIAGCTTFMTMAYIVIVNPKILEIAGIPPEASLIATALTAFFGTFLMGVYANRPFAIAPYMGENAFVAYTVVKVLGFSWQVALGGIFMSGLLFMVLTLCGARKWLIEAVPYSLKIAFGFGIGLFLIFIGLNETGIVTLGVTGAPVHVGNLSTPHAWLAILTFFLMCILLLRKIRAALLIAMLLSTVAGLITGLLEFPSTWVSVPSHLSTFGALDIVGTLQKNFLPVLLTMFILIFVDTMGTLIGVAQKGNLLDAQGNLPHIEKPLLCDALATMFGAWLGTSTSGVYVESAAGVQAGGRTGFTSVITAILFLLALFFTPILTIIPAYAYGPALMVIGLLMMTSIQEVNLNDLSEGLPVLMVATLMAFTYNLAIGMAAGFLIYPLLKGFSQNEWKHPIGVWILSFLSLLFFIFYPYVITQ